MGNLLRCCSRRRVAVGTPAGPVVRRYKHLIFAPQVDDQNIASIFPAIVDELVQVCDTVVHRSHAPTRINARTDALTHSAYM